MEVISSSKEAKTTIRKRFHALPFDVLFFVADFCILVW